MPDEYPLRRIHHRQPVHDKRSSKSQLETDAAAIELILRRAMSNINDKPNSRSPPTDPPSTDSLDSLRAQIVSLQQAHADALNALEQGRQAFVALEAKHQQFVDANLAFTAWRDDMERQRLSWADANAKFAKRHEEHKAARANLEAKYAGLLADLDDLKDRYSRAKADVARLGGPPVERDSPPLPSARPGDFAERRRKSSTNPNANASLPASSQKNLKMGAPGQSAPGYPSHLVEQSVLRERLTSDMFTLSQKVLEERATRAEEGRQMAERRIFELESQVRTFPRAPGDTSSRAQLAGYQASMSPTATSSSSQPPPPTQRYHLPPLALDTNRPGQGWTLPPISTDPPRPPQQGQPGHSRRRTRDRMDVDSLVGEGQPRKKRRNGDPDPPAEN